MGVQLMPHQPVSTFFLSNFPEPGPVIIPQRRPGNKDRGFVRAYASVLADCDISQVVFLNFLEGSFQASKVIWPLTPFFFCLAVES